MPLTAITRITPGSRADVSGPGRGNTSRGDQGDQHEDDCYAKHDIADAIMPMLMALILGVLPTTPGDHRCCEQRDTSEKIRQQNWLDPSDEGNRQQG